MIKIHAPLDMLFAPVLLPPFASPPPNQSMYWCQSKSNSGMDTVKVSHNHRTKADISPALER